MNTKNKFYTDIKFDNEGRELAIKGAKIVRDVVARTMGAHGKYAYLNTDRGVQISNDGANTIKHIKCRCKYEDMGAKQVIEAAEKTNQTCGDYTSGTSVIAATMMIEGAKVINEGIVNPVIFKNTMDVERENIIAKIKEKAIPINGGDSRDETIKAIASISAKEKKLGEIIAEAYRLTGTNSGYKIKLNKNQREHTFNVYSGFEYSHPTHPALITNKQNNSSFFEDVNVILIDKVVGKNFPSQFLSSILDGMKEQYIKNKVILVAHKWDINTLEWILKNSALGGDEKRPLIVPVSTGKVIEKEQSELIEDLSAVLNCKPYNEENGFNVGIKEIKKEFIGAATSVDIVPGRIRFSAEKNETVKNKVNELLNTSEEMESVGIDNSNILERISRLEGNIVDFLVYAPTNSELNEVASRIDDAFKACKTADKDGIVEGAGKTLRDIANELYTGDTWKDKVLYEVLTFAELQIRHNAGIEDEKLNGNAYNVVTREKCNLIESNIIDPAFSIIEGIKNGFSAATTLLLNDVFMVECLEE